MQPSTDGKEYIKQIWLARWAPGELWDAYLKQLDTHDHAQFSIRYQGADRGLTRELNNLNLQWTKKQNKTKKNASYVHPILQK